MYANQTRPSALHSKDLQSYESPLGGASSSMEKHSREKSHVRYSEGNDVNVNPRKANVAADPAFPSTASGREKHQNVRAQKFQERCPTHSEEELWREVVAQRNQHLRDNWPYPPNTEDQVSPTNDLDPDPFPTDPFPNETSQTQFTVLPEANVIAHQVAGGPWLDVEEAQGATAQRNASFVDRPDMVVEADLVTDAKDAPHNQSTSAFFDRKASRLRWVLAAITLIVIMAVGIGVGLSVGLGSNAPSPIVNKTQKPTTIAPTTSPPLNSFLESLPEVTQAAIEHVNSSQYKAFQWITSDEQQLQYTGEGEWRMAQDFALATLYYATGGDSESWTNSLHWLDPTSKDCGWYGCICTDKGAISSVNLTLDGLVGSLPREIGLISNLTDLNLGNNSLSAVIPTELGLLSNLWWLQLYQNSLSGSIPTELGLLSQLHGLTIWDNKLTSTLPTELTFLRSIVSLDVSNNSLHGPISADFGQLTKLTVLQLFQNQLSGTVPAELGHLSLLNALDVSVNKLIGLIPSELGSLTKLMLLGLDANALHGQIPTHLGLLRNLEYLNLDNNFLGGPIPTHFGNLINLQNCLRVYNNSLTGTIPVELSSLTGLGLLDMGNNNLNGTIPTDLGLMSSLTALGLGQNYLSGTIPTELGQLTRLTELAMDQNGLVGTIPTELDNLSDLTYFSLQANHIQGNVSSKMCELIAVGQLKLHVGDGVDCGTCNCLVHFQ